MNQENKINAEMKVDAEEQISSSDSLSVTDQSDTRKSPTQKKNSGSPSKGHANAVRPETEGGAPWFWSFKNFLWLILIVFLLYVSTVSFADFNTRAFDSKRWKSCPKQGELGP